MFRLYGLDQRIWKRWETNASQCQGNLTAQQITLAGAVAILKVIETLIESAGKAPEQYPNTDS